MAEPPVEGHARGPLGFLSLASGVLALVGAGMIGQASYGWVPGFDPPGWARVVTGWLLPAGAIAAVALGVPSLRRGPGRIPAIAGIVLAVVAVGVFVAMVASHPY